jgi:hypothetical protein
MKLFYSLLFVLLMLSGCGDYDQEEINSVHELNSAAFAKYQEENKLRLVDLDSVKSYGELISIMKNINCEGEIPGLKVVIKDVVYNLTGWAGCPNSNEVSCYFRVNHIMIKNDSIVTDRKNKLPVEQLDEVLREIISQPYTFQFDSDNVRPALISLYVEDKYPISVTKKVLKEIAVEFEKLATANNPDFFTYNILFRSFDYINIPPPPPPPISVEISPSN